MIRRDEVYDRWQPDSLVKERAPTTTKSNWGRIDTCQDIRCMWMGKVLQLIMVGLT